MEDCNPVQPTCFISAITVVNTVFRVYVRIPFDSVVPSKSNPSLKYRLVIVRLLCAICQQIYCLEGWEA